MVLSACPPARISRCTSSACCHCPLVLQAIISVLNVRVTGGTPCGEEACQLFRCCNCHSQGIADFAEAQIVMRCLRDLAYAV